MGPFGFIVLIIVVLMLVDIKWKQDKMLKKMDINHDLLKDILASVSNKPIEYMSLFSLKEKIIHGII